MYFLEIAEYYSRENNDDSELLKLLYQSLRAISVPSLDRKLVKGIYEIKAIVVNGEFPGIPDDRSYLDGAVHALQYVVNSSIEKLYTFSLNEECLNDFLHMADVLRKQCYEKSFKSLEILEGLL